MITNELTVVKKDIKFLRQRIVNVKELTEE